MKDMTRRDIEVQMELDMYSYPIVKSGRSQTEPRGLCYHQTDIIWDCGGIVSVFAKYPRKGRYKGFKYIKLWKKISK